MNTKKLFQLSIVLAILVTSLGSAGEALASSKCPSIITVQWGDTLSGIAQLCGTTVDAIRAANPGLGWWLYAGQTLYIPSGYTPGQPPATGGTYVVKSGDTLGKIAARIGSNVNAILAVNPQIKNANLIYVGQVINLPAGTKPPPHPTQPPGVPPPPYVSYGTLKIAYEGGMFIRSDPGGPIIASALHKTSWYYDLNSVFVDKKWKVWVKIKISPPVKGYSTGWLLVRDQYGTYFTSPKIDP
ncbi:MAG: LysM peptidoglycan-binding domain-containing protein [Anaerolineales bacterium]|nr:LysM peptidoglycan-binding domain-containing protein [Anaerolineales bacterium]NUQ85569.1 LysM peptidoglycan-binding domain-containing protein [Anaerolineales bacterium]